MHNPCLGFQQLKLEQIAKGFEIIWGRKATAGYEAIIKLTVTEHSMQFEEINFDNISELVVRIIEPKKKLVNAERATLMNKLSKGE